jgi:hypothetical protein
MNGPDTDKLTLRWRECPSDQVGQDKAQAHHPELTDQQQGPS